MAVIKLAGETDFEGWRAAARDLRRNAIPPNRVSWMVGEGELLAMMEAPPSHPDLRPRMSAGSPPPETLTPPFAVPTAFLDLAESAICHRRPDRFALLYRVLWRLKDEPNLLKIVSDGDVAALREMARNVSRASHKMKAFVRFRAVRDEDGEEAFIAWFEPAHHVVERTAGFFVRRFANQKFSILTPEACVHWNGEALTFTAGADRSAAPTEDVLEDYWRTYYASIFNPARLKVSAMRSEMPKRYWRNLPEAELIPELIAKASFRSEEMIRAEPVTPRRRIRPARAAERPAGDVPEALPDIEALIQRCRRCDLWRDATQGVAGRGAREARLMLVGEQPGDAEDLAGEPFVGPAGKVLDRAMAEAGVLREQVWITNAVKHFKHEPQGKRRLHKTPNAGEVSACRWWLDHERRLVRPRLILALGATAAHGVLGRKVRIGASRGEVFQLEDQGQAMVTLHPSSILRVPDAAAKAEAYGRLVEDLTAAWRRVTV